MPESTTSDIAVRAAERRHERAIRRYVRAFDAGDLDTMAEVVADAERDPQLDQLIAGVNAALNEEAGLPPLNEQGQAIRRRLAPYLPGGVPQPQSPTEPLTVGDVAARLEAEHAARQTMARLPARDRLTNRQLQQSRAPLPDQVTGRTLPDLIAQLAAEASERYWRLFREAAVMLGEARERGRGRRAAPAAAARHVAERSAVYEAPQATPDQSEDIRT